jgi:hypothetical protein
METRSQTNYDKGALYEVNIDFDEASVAWRQNKKQVSPGHFKYICTILKKDGTSCGNSCTKESAYCWGHRGHNKEKDKDSK